MTTTTLPYELSFTVRPEQELDVEKLGRIVGSTIPTDDSMLGIRAMHVFRAGGGQLLYTNYDIDKIPDRETADVLRDSIKSAWPHLYVPDPTQEIPDDEDWHGMFTREGGEAVQALLDRATARMSGGMVADLEQAIVQVQNERELIAAKHGEVFDTDVRERIFSRLEQNALDRGFTSTLFDELYQRFA